MENTNTEYQSKYDWALFAFRRVICEWWWPAEKPDSMSHSELFGNTEEFLEKIDYRRVRKPHGGSIVERFCRTYFRIVGRKSTFFQRICNPQILIFNELPFHHSINQKETCRNGEKEHLPCVFKVGV
jgi:hypothetical protein